MDYKNKSLVILMAEDDEDDCLLARDAFQEADVKNDVRFVDDGEQLMDYLNRRGKYTDPDNSPSPGLILLDLNMPRKDGREALSELKADPIFKRIPVIVLTTSRDKEDILQSYDLGANSFITKPATFERLVELMKSLHHYWIEFVELPQSV